MATDLPKIRDILIPIERYPHLNENKTLKEAVAELKAYTAGVMNRLRYDVLLVVNDKNQLVGKVSLVDIMKALFPSLFETMKVEKFEGKGSSFPNLAILLEDTATKECSLRAGKPVKDFMSHDDFFLQADTQILKTLSIMLSSGNNNIPVIDDKKVIGVIRLEEIFLALCSHCNI